MSLLKFTPLNQLENTGPAEHPARILIVEPDLALSEMLGVLFSESGYEFKIIRETTQIFPIIDQFAPDLVLIEYILPMVNGGELCTQIKESARHADLPVIMYSAYPQLLWSINDYRCDAFIPKPFDLEQLEVAIRRLLGKRKRRFGIVPLLGGIFKRLPFISQFN